jgi:hypothetical protein
MLVRQSFFIKKLSQKVENLCGPAEDLLKNVSSWYLIMRKLCTGCVKCRKRCFSISSLTQNIIIRSWVILSDSSIHFPCAHGCVVGGPLSCLLGGRRDGSRCMARQGLPPQLDPPLYSVKGEVRGR